MSEDERIAESAPETNVQPNTPTDTQTGAPADSQADATDATMPPDSAEAAEAPEARIAELEQLLAAERDAATDYMQRWQRAMADFSNYKRRAQQEQEQHEKLFAAQALMPVLHALDSFERAFASLPDSLRGFTWIEGVALVEYQLRHALDAQGITEVAAEPGQPFDPTRHHAVGEIETDQYPAGDIAAVLQRGYQTETMLMRPALVQVARAPETPEHAEKAGEAATAPAGQATPEETPPTGPAP